jgi:hypothetical protein
MALSLIQQVDIPDSVGVLAIVWVDRFGCRCGAYMQNDAMLQLICTDNDSNPAIAATTGIGASFDMVSALHTLLANVCGSLGSTQGHQGQYQLIKVAECWLENLKSHWYHNGYHMDWLNEINYGA